MRKMVRHFSIILIHVRRLQHKNTAWSSDYAVIVNTEMDEEPWSANTKPWSMIAAKSTLSSWQDIAVKQYALASTRRTPYRVPLLIAVSCVELRDQSINL